MNENNKDYIKGRYDEKMDNAKTWKIAFGWTLTILLISLTAFLLYALNVPASQTTINGLSENKTIQMCIDIAKALR